MFQLKWKPKGAPVTEECLIFGFDSPGELFEGYYTITHGKAGYDRAYPHNNNLVICGPYFTDVSWLSVSIPSIPFIPTGNPDDGTFRHVYPIINDPALPFRAGLTLHAAKGSWSSLPHQFEREEILTPRPMPFYEKFAYVTETPRGWGLQCRIGHLFDDRKTDDRYVWDDLPNSSLWINNVVVVRDRDICDIPLGAHPVTAGPGVRLGYFWLYWGHLEGRHKFEESRVV